MADAAHRAADLDQFLGRGGGAWDDFAIDRLVDHGAAGRETERAGARALLDDARHFRGVPSRRPPPRLLVVARHLRVTAPLRTVGRDIAWSRPACDAVTTFMDGN